jgi:hypothetical protein
VAHTIGAFVDRWILGSHTFVCTPYGLAPVLSVPLIAPPRASKKSKKKIAITNMIAAPPTSQSNTSIPIPPPHRPIKTTTDESRSQY